MCMKTELRKDILFGSVVFIVTLAFLGFIAQSYNRAPSYRVRSTQFGEATNHDTYSSMAKFVVGTDGTDPKSGCGCPFCCAAANS